MVLRPLQIELALGSLAAVELGKPLFVVGAVRPARLLSLVRAVKLQLGGVVLCVCTPRLCSLWLV